MAEDTYNIIGDKTMRQLIIARKDLNMSPGKLAAQVSYASMAFLTNAIRTSGIHQVLSMDTGETESYDITLNIPADIYEQWRNISIFASSTYFIFLLQKSYVYVILITTHMALYHTTRSFKHG